MFLLNSRLGLFVETYKRYSRRRHLFSRSYEAILPSSLMIVISTPEHTLLIYLCQFAVRSLSSLLEAFLVSVGSIEYISYYELMHPLRFKDSSLADLPTRLLFALSLASNHQINLPYCVTSSLKRY